ncbi:hypothetical protein SASPL_115148 [Salvia splendens]|uniref:(+)-piperitol/(+)-sesamin synthase n=1 Tax=Salvia splendens TaxID=180675 RepID=A0A8X8Y7F9_SALSN|nr:cytochrome P450 81Q32-like [Salvia splendens]KAG6424728.1 hypothetical protein SASPL_115148 [Salvia splendens]
MEPTLLFILISLPFLLISLKLYNSRKKLPPSPFPTLPLLGHLPLLKFPLHRTFLSLSRKLGPVFSLRLGTRLMVVVSSPAAAEECFTTNDITLANRPRFIIGKYIGYNYTSLVGAPYGDYWRNLRRLTATEIFSSARLNAFQSIRGNEVRLMLEKLRRKSGEGRVEIREALSEMAFNNIMRMVAGKRYFGVGEDDEEAEEFRGLIKEVFAYGGVSNLADFFPVLRWFDYKGVEKNLGRISARMDASLQALVDEQRRHGDGNTMISHLLAMQDSDPEYYTEEIIKCIIVMMLLVGTDTSSVTVEWAMSALLNNPDKMKKAREEIDKVIRNDRLLQESDLHNLPYLQNIISETLRLFPAAPLLVPHEASSDCKIAGYDVPRGAIVMVNAWAIHRDPSVWDDPETFKPERFEGGGIGAPNLLAFGMGRRACPGSGLAHRVVGLALGSLIQCFEWERVDERLVDLSEGKGASMPKNIPFEAKCRVSDVGRRVISV